MITEFDMKALNKYLYLIVIFFMSVCILLPAVEAEGNLIALFAMRKLLLTKMLDEYYALKINLKNNKYALIVAISDYDNVPKLNNTLNDARDVGEALENIGFHVRLVLDKDKRVIDKEISEYLMMLKSNEVSEGVIYIAGHGGQVYGRNYLFCKNALNERSDIDDNMVDIHDVWKKMENTGGLFRMMVLDVCRTNPFYFQESQEIKIGKMKKVIFGKNSRGLSPMKIDSNMTANAIALYSTDEDSDAVDGIGKNSPFAESFINWIKKPIDIFSVVNSITKEVREKTYGRQVPHMESSLTEGFILNRNDSLLAKRRLNDIEKRIKTFHGGSDSLAVKQRLIDIEKKIMVLELQRRSVEEAEDRAAKASAPKFVEP